MDVKGNFWRAISTIVIWVMLTGSIALSGVFLAEILGEDIIAVIILLVVTAGLSTGTIWNWGRGEGSQRRKRQWGRRRRRNLIEDELEERDYAFREKPKRDDRLADALRQLSDTELIGLREGIQRGEISEDELETVLRDRMDY
jgi:hypothetical protein